ncbi:MAG TPA: tryptophan synthase subunit alpha [candidate division Zixibacteria bacterium]|nr:tryptophan synthase subunit alpha [candidate division Zixibacteria bacterium]
MTELSKAFSGLAASGRKGFIPYITAGGPDLETTYEVMVALAEAGATVIELGVPFSDPMADGPVIQAACERALQVGTTLAKVLEVARRAWEKTHVPIVLFSYLNPLLQYGLEKLARDAKASGIAGVLVTDLPAESAQQFSALLRAQQIDLVMLIAPTTSDARLQKIAQHATGFLYTISVAGVTGARKQLSSDVRDLVARIRRVSQLPVAVGFGISTPEQAREAWQFADAVVVGSAIVRIIEAEGARAPQRVREFAQSFTRSTAAVVGKEKA